MINIIGPVVMMLLMFGVFVYIGMGIMDWRWSKAINGKNPIRRSGYNFIVKKAEPWSTIWTQWPINDTHKEGAGDNNIEPCPFCGTDFEVWIGENGSVYWVECDDCQIKGPVRGNRDDAIRSWNNRVKQSIEVNVKSLDVENIRLLVSKLKGRLAEIKEGMSNENTE